EIVNLNVTESAAGADFLKSSLYSGVEQLWQINTDPASPAAIAADTGGAGTVTVSAYDNFGDVVVGDGVTAGFKANGQTGTAAAVARWASATGSATAGATAVASAVDVKTATSTQKSVSIALDGVGVPPPARGRHGTTWPRR